jgi:hypothetical protein
MSTNLQSKRASLPEPEAQLDAKVAPQEQDTSSNATAPHSEEVVNKVDPVAPEESAPIKEAQEALPSENAATNSELKQQDACQEL